MNSSFVFIGLCCLLLLSGSSIIAVRPPQYLGICQWTDCVGEKQVGTHKIVCMPEEKPANCPEESWNQLKGLNEAEALEPC